MQTCRKLGFGERGCWLDENNWLPVSFPPVTVLGRPGWAHDWRASRVSRDLPTCHPGRVHQEQAEWYNIQGGCQVGTRVGTSWVGSGEAGPRSVRPSANLFFLASDWLTSQPVLTENPVV